MTPTIVNERALERFIESADLNEARRAEAALIAMAASVRMRVVELETRETSDAVGRAGELASVGSMVGSPARPIGGSP